MEVIEAKLAVRPLIQEIFGYLSFFELRTIRLVSKRSNTILNHLILESLRQRGISEPITSASHLIFIYWFVSITPERRFPVNIYSLLHLTQLALPLHHQVWKCFWNTLTNSDLCVSVLGLDNPNLWAYPKWVLQSLVLGTDTFDKASQEYLEAIDTRFAELRKSDQDVVGPRYINCVDAPLAKIISHVVVTSRQELGTKEFASKISSFCLRARGTKLHLSHSITCTQPFGELDLSRNDLQEISIAEGLALPGSLVLDENDFTEFPAEAIHAGKFKEVTLTANYLVTLTSPFELTYLTSLTLNACGIHDFPASFAKCLPSLIALNLSDNPLVSFDPLFLTYSQVSDQRSSYLYLQRTELTELHLALLPNSQYTILLEETRLTKLYFIVEGKEHLVVLTQGMWTDQQYLAKVNTSVNLHLDHSYPGYGAKYFKRGMPVIPHNVHYELMCKFDTHVARNGTNW